MSNLFVLRVFVYFYWVFFGQVCAAIKSLSKPTHRQPLSHGLFACVCRRDRLPFRAPQNCIFTYLLIWLRTRRDEGGPKKKYIFKIDGWLNGKMSVRRFPLLPFSIPACLSRLVLHFALPIFLRNYFGLILRRTFEVPVPKCLWLMKRKVNVILQFYNFHFGFRFSFCTQIDCWLDTRTHTHSMICLTLRRIQRREQNVNGLTGIYMPWQLLEGAHN